MDRDRLKDLIQAEREQFARDAPQVPRPLRGRPAESAGRGPDELDVEVAGRPSGLRLRCRRRADHRCGRQQLRRLLPGRHRRDGRARAGPHGRGGRGPLREGGHPDAPDRGLDLGRGRAARRFGLPKWQLTLSATDANRFAIRLARQITGRRRDSRVQLLLPRHGRRDLHRRRPGRTAGVEGRQRRSARSIRPRPRLRSSSTTPRRSSGSSARRRSRAS